MVGPPQRGLSRRTLLGGGVLLAAAYASAHVVGRLGGRDPDAVLGPTARTTLAAAFEVLLPSGAPVEELAAEVDTFMGEGDPVLAEQLRLALVVLEHAGGAGPLQFRRFSALPLEARAAVLDRWMRSSVNTKRQIYQGVRRAALFTWYARPESWADIGYDGPWVKQ